MSETAERIVLAARPPQGIARLDTWRLERGAIPTPGPGEMLLRTLWLSLDPYMRNRIKDEPSYTAPIPIGGIMEGDAISEVVSSNNPEFAPGDILFGRTGWQSHFVPKGEKLRRVDKNALPLSVYLGVAGMPGVTGYAGLLEIGKPQPGETVVVGAASGAVGATVGQVARIKGARAVGIAGGPEKCRYVREELGFDECVDHRSPTFAANLAKACPKGIDVYFEGIGGPVFEAVLPLMNTFARMPMCGIISVYTPGQPAPTLSVPALMGTMITKRITIKGFLYRDYASIEERAVKDITQWISEGKLKYRETVIEGLANAPEGLLKLLRGDHIGKVVVRVAQ